MEPPPGEVNRDPHGSGRTTITLCVPNKGNQASNDRMERYWSDRRAVDEILISDDRSEPALTLRQISDRIKVTVFPTGQASEPVAEITPLARPHPMSLRSPTLTFTFPKSQ